MYKPLYRNIFVRTCTIKKKKIQKKYLIAQKAIFPKTTFSPYYPFIKLNTWAVFIGILTIRF